MSEIEIAALAGAITILTGGIALGLGIWAANRVDDNGVETWVPARLERMPISHTLREVKPQPGRHRHPDDEHALSAGYEPRHGWAEVPPSIRQPLELMDPVARARELVRQIGQAAYSPYRRISDKRTRIWLMRHSIAARHGLPVLLGTMHPAGRLP